MKDLSHYASLAEMFRYPSEDLKKYASEWKRIVNLYEPALIVKLNPFLSFINDQPEKNLQEYYTGTFDVQPVCYLDIGYILFGEDFKRGIFLLNIKDEQEKVKNNCGTELPDHLTNILTLLPKIKDTEFAEELIYSMLIPALHEMISLFREVYNVYKGLLEILVSIMEADYPDSAFERFRINTRNKARDETIMTGIQNSDFNIQE
jgi:nitrate reductase assembly molybdenum cofactor insertion protein NarJ